MKARGMKRVALVLALMAFLVCSKAWAAGPTSVRGFSVQCAMYYAQVYQVPHALVDAVIQVESNWNPYAVSAKGAAGLMQLMPGTAARFGVRDRFNIRENIRGGVAYLAWLIWLFRGDLRLAVAAYFVGEAPILSRGLAYSSRQVFDYVSQVARVFRRLRLEAMRTSVRLSVSAEP